MPSPITGSDFNNQSVNGSLCDQFRDKLLNNEKIKTLLDYLFDDTTGKIAYDDDYATPATLGADIAVDILQTVCPIGQIVTFPSDTVLTADNGWLPCTGTEYPQATYPKLYAILGAAYGDPGTPGNFKVPNLNDKFLVGKSGTKLVATTAGAESSEVTLEVANLPDHQHKTFLQDSGAAGSLVGAASPEWVSIGDGSIKFYTDQATTKTYFMRTRSETSIFEASPITIDTLPPYLALAFYIRAGWKIAGNLIK